MTQDEIIEMARQAGFTLSDHGRSASQVKRMMTNFAKLVAAKEREAIAQMIDDARPLLDFARNEQGGCVLCGFTPKLAAKIIRARGEAWTS